MTVNDLRGAVLLAAVISLTAAPGSGQSGEDARYPRDFRSIDGRGNNRQHPDWGAADTTLLRLTRSDYADGIGLPAGPARLSPRAVSNLCAQQGSPVSAAGGLSSFVWQWGQFLDHDLSLTVPSIPTESFDIVVPRGDSWFDPAGSGQARIRFQRSEFRVQNGVREQMNRLTAYIDGSQIYGSSAARERALRMRDESGKLRSSENVMLPFNTDGLENQPSPDAAFFVAGDIRANEQVGLTAMHTLFLREHNFWAGSIRTSDPGLRGEMIYQMARAIVGAELQLITYRDFLPLVLGPDALPPYGGYRPEVNASITNEFATAAFRFGHSMLPTELLRLNASGTAIVPGHLSLADAFFNPNEVFQVGIEPVLRGLVVQPAQEVDPHLVDAVRNFLFGAPGSGGFDLASLNLQRGRDHGLPSYNETRRLLGLRPVSSFAEIHPDSEIQANLRLAFENVEEIDLWMGGLSEPHMPGALVGETFYTIILDQFRRLRDGDRFWYQIYLPPAILKLVEKQTLSAIIRRNGGIGTELVEDVFRTPR